MKDQRDNGVADAVEDGGHRLEVAKVNVERAERSDDDKVRKDEGPTADPSAQPAAQVGDINPDLNGERSRQRLTDGDGLAHLLLAQPAALGDDFPLHLADQRDGPAEPQQAKAQKVKQQLRQPTVLCHRRICLPGQAPLVDPPVEVLRLGDAPDADKWSMARSEGVAGASGGPPRCGTSPRPSHRDGRWSRTRALAHEEWSRGHEPPGGAGAVPGGDAGLARAAEGCAVDRRRSLKQHHTKMRGNGRPSALAERQDGVYADAPLSNEGQGMAVVNKRQKLIGTFPSQK
jgi:hypothetical protein